ncbi:YtcA family lipoprotein [Cupriavidus sp. CV2]|uniref:YtcA family lipoprotein n=1 Tax=Cupriavidus ulmosensis TaxID=3065913 RepID=UPI00296B4A65|nr:YtcA family lipoprotein [Cupriavidus sp. CV2]MDW3688467.1 YtcA family lipoprotein [Cupriavidus sp. CV2]
MRAIGVAAVVGPSVGGCAKSPSLSVLGAYFPDWMFCIIAGVALAIACYLVLERAGSGYWLGPPAVAYPALTTLFSLVVWLILFRH